MILALLAFATFVSTLLGGLFSLRYRNKLHLVMGFAAGVLLGVVAFDIFPEIVEGITRTGIDPVYPMVALVAGFLLFHILEKSIMIHHAHEGEEEYTHHHHPHVGVMSALALIGHSLMDGMAIGLGFQVSPSVGILVAIAVISHDFTDGMNTVILMLRHKNTAAKAMWFLLLDAVVPVIGALSTLFFQVSETFLIIYLGFFAGFLLYLGASDILPEAHRERSSRLTIALTVFGALLIFVVTRLAH